jgi:hypothetical protein
VAADALIASIGNLPTPVRVKVVGPAFFDGEHRRAPGTAIPPHNHGHCNRDSRSLWGDSSGVRGVRAAAGRVAPSADSPLPVAHAPRRVSANRRTLTKVEKSAAMLG